LRLLVSVKISRAILIWLPADDKPIVVFL